MLLWSITPASILASSNERFDESLLIRPLADGKVVSHFEFTTITSSEDWLGTSIGETIESGHACYAAILITC